MPVSSTSIAVRGILGLAVDGCYDDEVQFYFTNSSRQSRPNSEKNVVDGILEGVHKELPKSRPEFIE